jgi:hypothetical protein
MGVVFACVHTLHLCRTCTCVMASSMCGQASHGMCPRAWVGLCLFFVPSPFLLCPFGCLLPSLASVTLSCGHACALGCFFLCVQSSLLRIIAGLWTADDGFVSVPCGGTRQGTLFVPQRSYMVKVRGASGGRGMHTRARVGLGSGCRRTLTVTRTDHEIYLCCVLWRALACLAGCVPLWARNPMCT